MNFSTTFMHQDGDVIIAIFYAYFIGTDLILFVHVFLTHCSEHATE